MNSYFLTPLLFSFDFKAVYFRPPTKSESVESPLTSGTVTG